MAVSGDTPLRHAKGMGLLMMSNWGWSAAHTPMYSNIKSEPKPWGVGANRLPCQTLSAAQRSAGQSNRPPRLMSGKARSVELPAGNPQRSVGCQR